MAFQPMRASLNSPKLTNDFEWNHIQLYALLHGTSAFRAAHDGYWRGCVCVFMCIYVYACVYVYVCVCV
jgi:hypothetical protein